MLYADYNATTPISADVAAAMQPFLAEQFGNPSAVGNRLGARARTAIEEARSHVAAFAGAHPSEVVFVSGGTESCAHALLGAMRASEKGRTLMYSSVEHSAVIEAAAFARDCLQTNTVTIPVDRNGKLDIERLLASCRLFPGALASLMLANNETGVLFPIAEIRRELASHGVSIHCDAVQAIGKLKISFAELGVDFLSLSAHKFGGPKGVGALLIRQGACWQPVVKGGGQEEGRRGGTEAVALIVGMGEAARKRAHALANGEAERISELRNGFESAILSEVPDVAITGANEPRLPNTSGVRIEGINSQDLIAALAAQDVIVAAGSACSSTGHKPSRVLTEMGFSAVECISTVRVSFGSESKKAEVERLVELIKLQTEVQRQAVTAELKQLLTPS